MSTQKNKSRKRGYDVNKLNVQQQNFVKALLADPAYNASNAAKEAGYANPAKAAHRLMSNKKIKAIIDKEITQRQVRLEIKGDDVLKELADIALRDVADLCNAEGKLELENLKNLPLRIRRSIDGIKVRTKTDPHGNEYTTVELKLCSKLQAIDMMMKHLGMYEKDNQQQTTQILNLDDLVRVEGVPQNQVIDVENFSVK